VSEEFESLEAALEGHFDKSLAELTNHQRLLIRQRVPYLAEPPPDGLPASTNTAIVGNAATAVQGAWQYSTDGETTWIDIPVNLSDANALILPTPVALRFNRAPNWDDTPGALTARVYYGDTGLPAPDVRDISRSVGVTGQWTVGTISISVDDATGELAFSCTLWDFLATGAGDLAERRRVEAQKSDGQHNPARDQRAAARIRDAAFKIEVAEDTPSRSHSDELAKQTLLDRYRQQLAQAEADLERSLAPEPPTGGTSRHTSSKPGRLAPARRHDNRDWIAKALVEEFPPPPDIRLPPGAVTVLPPGTSVRMAVDRLAARNVGTSQATISRLIGRKKK
jgi:hypothetical protein